MLSHEIHFKHVLRKIHKYIQDQQKNTETAILKGLQLHAITAIYNFLSSGKKEGYVVAPTGFGKTVLFTQLLKAINEPAYFVTPRKNLLHQAVHEFNRFAEDLDIGLVYGLIKEFNKDVIVITYESFVQQTKKKRLDMNRKFIFLDEPHMCLTEKRIAAVSEYRNAIKIGLTATPYYSDEKKVANLLPNEIYSVSVQEGVEEGFLCPFMIMLAETDTDISKVKIEAGEYNIKDLSQAVNIDSRNRAAVKLYQTVPAFWNKSAFIHCVTIEHAISVAKTFREFGVNAQAVHSRLTEPEIEKMLYDFRAGTIKVLCNVDMLTMGFDAPIATVCFNLRPTKSVVTATQRVRNLRIDPLNPKKFAYIVDFFDQNENGKGHSISYADIIKQTFVVPERLRHIFPQHKMEKMLNPKVKIDSLKVHTSYKKILQVTAKRKALANQNKFLTYEEWEKEVRAAGITTGTEYFDDYKNHKGWPSVPGLIYTLFPGWRIFFGKPEVVRGERLKFDQWIEEVKALKIGSLKEYQDHLPDHLNWPEWPYSYKEFPGWNVLNGNPKEFLPLDVWSQQVCSLQILTQKQYQEAYVKYRYKGWPSNPSSTYGMPFFE